MARSKHKKNSAGRFLALPLSVVDCPNFVKLSGGAAKLLICAGSSYNGFNNGDIHITLEKAKSWGWRSSSTLAANIAELLHLGFIEKSRQGGLNCCSLYALSWHPINECGGKLDLKPTAKASGKWKQEKRKWKRRSYKNTSPSSILKDHKFDIETSFSAPVSFPNQSAEKAAFSQFQNRTPLYIYPSGTQDSRGTREGLAGPISQKNGWRLRSGPYSQASVH
jgi:hypothetical protein